MENKEISWQKRKGFIVPILLGLIATFLPMVVPMSWGWMLVCCLVIAVSVGWLIFIFMPAIISSRKGLRAIVWVSVIILLGGTVFYRVREQWLKDYPAPVKKEASIPATEQPKQATPEKEAKQAEEQKKKIRSEMKEQKKEVMSPPVIGGAEATSITVALRFVYPESPALVIVNESDSIVRDIKWMVVLWNMDLPERDDPLPIRVQPFDWLKAHEEGGPQNLFGSSSVAPLLKPGNRLFGSASVDCPICTKTKTYIVYITWGEGGWFAEVKTKKSGGPLVPAIVPYSKNVREKYFAELENMVPEQARLPIEEYRFRKLGEDRFSAKRVEIRADSKKRLDEDLEKIEKREIPEIKLKVGAGIPIEAKVTWGLKSRANFLSYRILRFLKNRERNEPDMEKKDISNEEKDRRINYLNETMTEYSSMFRDEVISIRNEFADHKKRDKELDKYYKHPANPIEILIIAEHIEALADQL